MGFDFFLGFFFLFENNKKLKYSMFFFFLNPTQKFRVNK